MSVRGGPSPDTPQFQAKDALEGSFSTESRWKGLKKGVKVFHIKGHATHQGIRYSDTAGKNTVSLKIVDPSGNIKEIHVSLHSLQNKFQHTEKETTVLQNVESEEYVTYYPVSRASHMRSASDTAQNIVEFVNNRKGGALSRIESDQRMRPYAANYLRTETNPTMTGLLKSFGYGTEAGIHYDFTLSFLKRVLPELLSDETIPNANLANLYNDISDLFPMRPAGELNFTSFAVDTSKPVYNQLDTAYQKLKDMHTIAQAFERRGIGSSELLHLNAFLSSRASDLARVFLADPDNGDLNILPALLNVSSTDSDINRAVAILNDRIQKQSEATLQLIDQREVESVVNGAVTAVRSESVSPERLLEARLKLLNLLSSASKGEMAVRYNAQGVLAEIEARYAHDTIQSASDLQRLRKFNKLSTSMAFNTLKSLNLIKNQFHSDISEGRQTEIKDLEVLLSHKLITNTATTPFNPDRYKEVKKHIEAAITLKNELQNLGHDVRELVDHIDVVAFNFLSHIEHKYQSIDPLRSAHQDTVAHLKELANELSFAATFVGSVHSEPIRSSFDRIASAYNARTLGGAANSDEGRTNLLRVGVALVNPSVRQFNSIHFPSAQKAAKAARAEGRPINSSVIRDPGETVAPLSLHIHAARAALSDANYAIERFQKDYPDPSRIPQKLRQHYEALQSNLFRAQSHLAELESQQASQPQFEVTRTPLIPGQIPLPPNVESVDQRSLIGALLSKDKESLPREYERIIDHFHAIGAPADIVINFANGVLRAIKPTSLPNIIKFALTSFTGLALMRLNPPVQSRSIASLTAKYLQEARDGYNYMPPGFAGLGLDSVSPLDQIALFKAVSFLGAPIIMDHCFKQISQFNPLIQGIVYPNSLPDILKIDTPLTYGQKLNLYDQYMTAVVDFHAYSNKKPEKIHSLRVALIEQKLGMLATIAGQIMKPGFTKGKIDEATLLHLRAAAKDTTIEPKLREQFQAAIEKITSSPSPGVSRAASTSSREGTKRTIQLGMEYVRQIYTTGQPIPDKSFEEQITALLDTKDSFAREHAELNEAIKIVVSSAYEPIRTLAFELFSDLSLPQINKDRAYRDLLQWRAFAERQDPGQVAIIDAAITKVKAMGAPAPPPLDPRILNVQLYGAVEPPPELPAELALFPDIFNSDPQSIPHQFRNKLRSISDEPSRQALQKAYGHWLQTPDAIAVGAAPDLPSSKEDLERFAERLLTKNLGEDPSQAVANIIDEYYQVRPSGIEPWQTADQLRLIHDLQVMLQSNSSDPADIFAASAHHLKELISQWMPAVSEEMSRGFLERIDAPNYRQFWSTVAYILSEVHRAAPERVSSHDEQLAAMILGVDPRLEMLLEPHKVSGQVALDLVANGKRPQDTEMSATLESLKRALAETDDPAWKRAFKMAIDVMHTPTEGPDYSGQLPYMDFDASPFLTSAPLRSQHYPYHTRDYGITTLSELIAKGHPESEARKILKSGSPLRDGELAIYAITELQMGHFEQFNVSGHDGWNAVSGQLSMLMSTFKGPIQPFGDEKLEPFLFDKAADALAMCEMHLGRSNAQHTRVTQPRADAANADRFIEAAAEALRLENPVEIEARIEYLQSAVDSGSLSAGQVKQLQEVIAELRNRLRG